MLPRISWRRRALAWSALPAGSALLLAVACTPAPLPLAAHLAAPSPAHGAPSPAAPDQLLMADPAVRPLPGHDSMPMAAHAPLVAAAGPSAPAGGAPAVARAAEPLADGPLIDIQAFQYSAPVLTIPVGTTVTWVNHDVEPHTVTANNRAFASGGLQLNDTYSFRFDTPGTFVYHCALHPFMTAQIVVQ